MGMPDPVYEYTRESIAEMSGDKHFDDMFPLASEAALAMIELESSRDMLQGFLAACDGIDHYTRARQVMPGFLLWEYLAWREGHSYRVVNAWLDRKAEAS